MRLRILFLFLMVSTISFSQGSNPPVEVPKIVVKMAVGEEVDFEKATIKLVGVLEDSRCPKEVTCIWEGQAKVLIEISEAGKKPIQKEVILKSATTALFSSEGYEIKGISLSPYPQTPKPIDAREYSLLVSEERN